MSEPFVVRREIQIAAPPATVFAFLTDPEKIVGWMGAEATSEAHPGGLYLLKGVGGDHARTARGAFREVVPVHRLAYSIGWEGSGEVPPGSSLIEIDLVDRDGGTLLHMTHSGLPNAAQCASHDRGWAHYLSRLAMAAAGRNPGVDRGVERRGT
ncbi:SRPBCC domain-containing protein [Methylocapsa sp. S129]|uniref:SRPBCC family protein n=1 Tax=Methylocapsa sp. S129 TaxID=1641869 RepID=UPI00131CD195|nr:SRPBCC domain-containing protein [Methylocapsa sp. S129]